MPIFTDEELAIMEKNPETAPLAKKAKEAGDYIPKSRFDEVITERNAKAEALAKIEADNKAADEDRAKKGGEFEKLDAQSKARIAELEKQFESEKKVADEFRTAKTARIETMKKDFGDAWLPEYEGFSMSSLDKLQAQRKAANKETPDGGKPGIKYNGKTMTEMTPVEREAYIAAVKRGEIQTT